MELKTFFAQDLQGNVIPNPTVTLYLPGTATLATGLQNAAGAALSNPFTGGSMGQITLAAPDGNYDMKIAGGGRELVMRVRFNSASDTAVAASISATASADAAQESAEAADAARALAVAAQLEAAAYAEAAAGSAAAAESALQAGQFTPDAFVPRAGGVAMTGHLSVPAGATGDQVPRASEVVSKAGDTMTGHLEVPAGATGSQVPRSSEIFGKGQSWQTVTRTSGVTYTNSTGKPILLTIRGAATAATAAMYVEIDGGYSCRDTGWFVGDEIVLTAVIPNGSTYKYVATNVGSITIREYR